MPVNWGMGLTVDQPKMDAMEAFRAGQDRRREHDARNAMVKLATGEYRSGGQGIVADPKAEDAQFEELLKPIAMFDPAAAIKMREKRQQDAEGGAQRQQDKTMQLARLLNHATDEASYQQAVAAARQLGLDVNALPAGFDPAWINQQKIIVNAYTKDGGQAISGIARELIDAGYKPGTPEFTQAMHGVINNKYATDYMDESGNTRRRPTLNLGTQPAAASGIPPEAIAALQAGHGSDEQFDEIFGPGAAARVKGGQQGAPAGGFLAGQ